MPTSPLLSLPAEARFRMYRFCTPVYAHVDQVQGLLQSCRQLRHEYESEAVKVMHHFLTSIEKEWPHPQKLRFLRPRSLADVHEVTAQLPLSLYFPVSHRMDKPKFDSMESTCMETCTAPLYRLFLSTLTFSYYDDCGDFKNLQPNIVPTGLLHDMSTPLVVVEYLAQRRDSRAFRYCVSSTGVHVRKLVYDWTASKVANTTASDYTLAAADNASIAAFVGENYDVQYPVGLVHRWKLGDGSLCFDLGARDEPATPEVPCEEQSWSELEGEIPSARICIVSQDALAFPRSTRLVFARCSWQMHASLFSIANAQRADL